MVYINVIYAQEDFSTIRSGDIVFFLAGPTNKEYSWRRDLVKTVRAALVDVTEDITVHFLIPEGRYGHWAEMTTIPHSFQNTDPELYLASPLPFAATNQIQWETLGLEKGYVIYNMCQHWRLEPSRGLHGNIGPTSRMEVCPQYCDAKKWIFYNNEHGEPKLNNLDTVVFGGEAPGESVGWLLWWIAKRKLQYINSPEGLVQRICTIIYPAGPASVRQLAADTSVPVQD